MAGDSFFASDKKRKRPSQKSDTNKRPHGKPSGSSLPKRAARDEELSSGDEQDREDIDNLDFTRDDVGLNATRYDSGEEEELNRTETPGEKRIRLAKGYLSKVREEVANRVDDGTFDAAEIDRELIAARLKQDVEEQSGSIHLFLQSKVSQAVSASSTVKQHFLPALHNHAVTATHASPTHLYVANKSGSVARYDLRTMRLSGNIFGQAGHETESKGKEKQNSGQGHKGSIFCLAASEDGKYVVTGGKDKLVGVWEVQPGSSAGSHTRRSKNSSQKRKTRKAGEGGVKWVRGLSGHKDTVTSVSIPPLSNPSLHFMTTSLSRLLCLQSLSTLSTIDTFFGHQDSIASVSALKPTMAVTSGGRDRTARWWKVEEEVQLVFRGGGKTVNRPEAVENGEEDKPNGAVNGKTKTKSKDSKNDFYEGSMDVVCILDDSHFLSGGDSGSICLWHTGKKKPIFTAGLAHGMSETRSETEGIIIKPRWITSLASLRGTDLFVSGSSSGEIKLWALERNLKSFTLISDISAKGYVNSLQLLAVPPRNVQPDKWVDERVRKAHKDKVRAAKKERRKLKRQDGLSTPMDQDEAAEGALTKDEIKSVSPDADLDPEDEGANSDEELDASEDDDGTDEDGETRIARLRRQINPAKVNPEILLFASLSREPRLGRWDVIKAKDVKNGTLVVHLGTQSI